MPLFEVFIPSSDPNGLNITAKIRADSWIQALRNGLSKLGDTTDVRNVMCDITEQGIDVTEPRSGKVFRIRELPEGTPMPAASPAAAPAAVHAPVSAPATAPQAPTAPAPAKLPAEPSAPQAQRRFVAQVAEEVVTQEKATPGAARIGRAKPAPSARTIEDTIAELFDETQKLYAIAKVDAAANFILDLAMKVIPAESGAVFGADINKSDLYFLAARGPKAQEAMKFRVAVGQGIVGFCAQESVSLAVSDVHKDPRFYAVISKALGYETKSILCSPSQGDGRVFGALELINKRAGSSFTSYEVDLLNYLAHVFGDYVASTGQLGD